MDCRRVCISAGVATSKAAVENDWQVKDATAEPYSMPAKRMSALSGSPVLAHARAVYAANAPK